MICLVRITTLLGGVLLLIMTVGGNVVRQEPSEAFLVASLSIEPQDNYGIVITTPDGTRLKQLTTNPEMRLGDGLYWSADGRSLYYDHNPYDYTGTDPRLMIRFAFPSGDQQIVSELRGVSNLFLSPDRRWIIFKSGGYIVMLDTGTNSMEIIDSNTANYITWSQNSEWIHYSKFSVQQDGAVVFELMAVESGAKHHVSAESFISPLWSPNGQQLAFIEGTNERGRLHIYDLANEVKENISDIVPNRLDEWLADGWLIVEVGAASQGIPQQRLYRLRSDGSEYGPLFQGDGSQMYIGTSDDGQWVYFSNYQFDPIQTHRIYRVNPHTLETDLLLTPERFQDGFLSETGDRVIFRGRYSGEYGLFVMNIDGSHVQQLLSINEADNDWRVYSSPVSDWVEVLVLYDVNYEMRTRLLINIYTGDVRELPRSNKMSYSPIVDMEWEPLGVIGIGVGMVLGSLGMMGLRFRRTA